MNRPVIFLDFDGVLNTEQYQARLTMDGRPAKDAWGPLFDPQAVSNLRRIIEATDAGIVVSSSWRYAHSLDSLRTMWERRKLPGEILDTIPCGARYVSRGEDTDCWLNRHGCRNYVIIDDIDDFYPSQHQRFIETNPITGLKEADALKAIAILTPISNNNNNMENEISNWNGYPVRGDISELDAITTSANIISLDKNDIIGILSAGGDNQITVGRGQSLREAFDAAVNELSAPLQKVMKIIIDFQYGNKQPAMSELPEIAASLSEANPEIEVTWGLNAATTADDSFKVILVTSS